MQRTQTLIVLENQIHKKVFSRNGTFQSTPRKFLIFQETETPKKNFIFQETETPKKSLYFRKRNILIFRERYIQNPNMFRTLVYSNQRHIQNIFKHVRWNDLQKQLPSALFSLSHQNFSLKKFPKKPALKKFLTFSQKTLCTFWSQLSKTCSEKISYIFSKKSLIFQKWKTRKKSLYIRKQNFLIFQEVTFQDQKFFILLLIKKQNFLN